MIRASVTLAAIAALSLIACQPRVPEPPRNLVVICLDTVRYDSFMDREVTDALTPWLESAQIYTNAISPAPWTMPGVSSLFTGLYPVEHGAGRFRSEVANLDTEVPSPLPPGARTLAEILDEHHFRTGAFVSHPFFIEKLGLRQGFQVVHNRRGWFRDVERMWQWADRIEAPHRFFGYLHFMEAHHRHTRSDTELDEFLATGDETTLDYLRGLHPDNCSDPLSRRCRQTLVYDAAVLELRTAVASVLQDLAGRDLLDDTLVLVYSDHGEEFWDHEEIQKIHDRDPRAHAGLGHGQSLYRELLRVPLLAWHPRLAGQRHDQPVSLIDVLPSLLRWLDVEEPELQVSGKPLPPLYRDWFGRAAGRTLFASGIAYGPEQVATRREGIKAIFTLGSDAYEIYNLRSDPLERRPLQDTGLLLEHETLAGDYLERAPIAAGEGGDLGAREIEDLKAIGYLQGVESGRADEEEAAGDPDDSQDPDSE